MFLVWCFSYNNNLNIILVLNCWFEKRFEIVWNIFFECTIVRIVDPVTEGIKGRLIDNSSDCKMQPKAQMLAGKCKGDRKQNLSKKPPITVASCVCCPAVMDP